MLQRLGEVVRVAVVEVGGHVHGHEHLDVFGLVGVRDADLLVWNVEQLGVLRNEKLNKFL